MEYLEDIETEKKVEEVKAELFEAIDKFYAEMTRINEDYTLVELNRDVNNEIAEFMEYVEG
jgi:hypothetical protein